MKIQRFEDLECWKEARKLVSMVYEAVHSSQDFRKDYGLKNQVTDAAVSVMSNIAEGFSRHSNKEFIQFLFISKSSASEVQSILYVTLDQTYIDQPAFDRIYTQAEKVSRLDSGLITYLLRNQNNYNNKKSDRKTRTSEVVLKSDKTQQTQQTQNSVVLIPYVFLWTTRDQSNFGSVLVFGSRLDEVKTETFSRFLSVVL